MQTELFYEDIYSAYRSGIEHCGGAKRVGQRLFPEKSPDAAGHYLMACINPARNEKMSEEQRLLLLKIFRENAFHGAMYFLCDDVMYERPRTVEPEDEAAEIQRAMDATMDRLDHLFKRYERIQQASAIRSVK